MWGAFTQEELTRGRWSTDVELEGMDAPQQEYVMDALEGPWKMRNNGRMMKKRFYARIVRCAAQGTALDKQMELQSAPKGVLARSTSRKSTE